MNVTYHGISREFRLDDIEINAFSDDDVIRLSEEVAILPRGALAGFVVDRIENDRIYVRPKVPFGNH